MVCSMHLQWLCTVLHVVTYVYDKWVFGRTLIAVHNILTGLSSVDYFESVYEAASGGTTMIMYRIIYSVFIYIYLHKWC